MNEYTPTIGLEIHAELATAAKMFCSCKNDPDEERVNVNICPVCMAHPGALPTINKAAVEHVLRVGAAVNGTLATFSEFDRKSYFYPDIPKGYQISQYKYPLVSGGELAGVAITRIHLEEDTASSTHHDKHSAVNFNRAGVPLMELVTEPVIHDAQTAAKFARELQLLLRTLGVSQANLEKGEMRIEANISVSKTSSFGTKVEVKNLNSFRSVERAIEFEVARQIELIEKGEKVVQATRGFDETKGTTFHQRTKEGSADYRYFPEPDLPKMRIDHIPAWSREELLKALPELPHARRARYSAHGLKESDIAFFVGDSQRERFLDTLVTLTDGAVLTAAVNFTVTDVFGYLGKFAVPDFKKLTPEHVVATATLFTEGTISSRGAKDLLPLLIEDGGDAYTVAKEKNFIQIQDEGALLAIVESVLMREAAAVAELKAGKESLLQFLIGQCMKESKGSGNPAKFSELIKKNVYAL